GSARAARAGAAAELGVSAERRQPLLRLGALRALGSARLGGGEARRHGAAAGDGPRVLLGAGAARMVAGYLAFLALFGAERIAELLLSRRNARIALAHSGVESGAAHFRWMAAVHALFLPACAAEVLLLRRPFPGSLGWACAGAALGAQALRWWAISRLGWRWNVRVIVVPGESPVRAGPYRFVRHPNYVAVAIEMACVPLVHGAWICA